MRTTENTERALEKFSKQTVTLSGVEVSVFARRNVRINEHGMSMRILKHLLLLALAGCAVAPPPVTAPPSDGGPVALTVDPKIHTGTLANGLRYYIRENGKPEQRAELRLVVNAGSILEDEDQQGLAHFAEHMAFNGTRRFPKQALVDYLESIGMRFGPDVNAYTSFDETVYMLQVPTDSTAVFEKGFEILSEWSQHLTFDTDEVDKERGVVIEEWRLRRGAGQRMRDKLYPDLFRGSRYADRLPIGKKELLETFDHATLRQFYAEWYRPDLMAVVAVGDFDVDSVQVLIKRHFGPIQRPEIDVDRVVWPVPDHDETIVNIVTDPEASRLSVSVIYKQPLQPQESVEDYRRSLVGGLYNGMLNQRLQELARQEDPPFLGASSGQGRWVRSKEVYFLGAGVREGGIERGLDALLTEAARVSQHGFTTSELIRQKARSLRSIEQIYRERDKSRSRGFASEYIRNFLTDEPIPGIEREYELYQTLIPTITLAEVNGIATTWIKDHSRVLSIQMPEKEGLKVPSEAELLAVLAKVEAGVVEPYVDDVTDLPLVETPPSPGSVVTASAVPQIEVTEWTLSNGVRVLMRPTDFKNDEILFTGWSPGGISLVEDEDHVAATSAVTVLREGGIGPFSLVQLQKKLAGKVVRLSPQLSALGEGLRGSASPEDLETLFQLIYLSFTAPRADSTAFNAWVARTRGRLENRDASPRTAYNDTIRVTMSQYHPRSRPWTLELLDEADLQKSLEIYRDRFADASDFTFLFVGNFEPETIRPLVETYLGGLPALNRDEIWVDRKVRPPKGVIQKTVHRGIEPKSTTRVVFTGPFEWNWQNRYDLNAVASAFRIKLREVLREDLSGTYGVRVGASRTREPVGGYALSIGFGCDPERAEELREVLFTQIDSLKQVGLDQTYIDKVKEIQRRSRETDLKENSYWLNTLRFYYSNDEDPTNILRAEEKIDGLTMEAVKAAANQYFDTTNYAQFVLMPESSLQN